MKLEPVIIMTTTNTDREAKNIAHLLVKDRLAACVQIIPKIQSIYEWDDDIHDDQEYLILVKTKSQLVGDIKKMFEKHHSYEVPEFLVVPVIDGTEGFFEWMKDVTK